MKTAANIRVDRITPISNGFIDKFVIINRSVKTSIRMQRVCKPVAEKVSN